ncbi:hypothetical protein BMS3Bbin04_00941 [bacterium BMS3Bbin04]|nr:hypothetical protein BMS3Bbin04_00941 [bacterium BMS3Bbin04]
MHYGFVDLITIYFFTIQIGEGDEESAITRRPGPGKSMEPVFFRNSSINMEDEGVGNSTNHSAFSR